MVPASRADDVPPCRDPRLAELCHRVRTPLHGVLGSLELLLGTDLDPAAAELARAAFLAAGELHRAFEGYVDDVLADEVLGEERSAGGQTPPAAVAVAAASPSMR